MMEAIHAGAAMVAGDTLAHATQMRKIVRNTAALRHQRDLHFNTLFCLINIPFGRYHDCLERSGNLAAYMRTLQGAFNTQVERSKMKVKEFYRF